MDKEEYLNSDFVKMAHLNNQVVFLTQRNKKLQKENEQLKQKLVGKENEFKYFSNSFQSKIKELQKQIEKMKCCDNCFNQFDEYQCRTCQNKSNWSLAE